MAWDLVVVGGGISGLSLAWAAARAGRRVVLLEQSPRLGGCIYSHRANGFWYEMGAHTVYNSYGGLLEMAQDTGITRKLVQRGPARVNFGLLRDGRIRWLTPLKVLLQLNWLRMAFRAPVGIFRRKRGKTVEGYYTGLLGKKNFRRVLSPFFAAVPSQNADGFPVSGPGSLFKKRPRREEFPRSYGFDGGLQSICDALGETPGVTVECGATASGMARSEHDFVVTTRDGRGFRAPRLGVALPVPVAAGLLEEQDAGLAGWLKQVGTVRVESLGFVLPRKKCWMPECAFVVPVEGSFYSMVTRDPFPDPERRAFCFHFKGGVPREEKLNRAAEVLKISPDDFGRITENQVTLPAPALGHDRIVAGIDECLAGRPLALTGNYFAGLAIEDCVQRSLAEWKRIEGVALS
jgi:UDP-galactopyranose mutase